MLFVKTQHIKVFQRVFSSVSSLVEATPKWSLIDKIVTIEGNNLDANLDVVLETSLVDEAQRINMKSECIYATDDYGNFNTSKQSPKCGSSYQGVHSSGPLWSVTPQKNSLVRLWPKDIMKTLHYSFVLKDRNSGQILAKDQICKSFVSPGVKRIPIRTGRIRGTLFLPVSPGPGIITIYGGVNKGQVPEDRFQRFSSQINQKFVTEQLC